jgi:hypothetical protein
MSTDMLYSNDLNFDGVAAIFDHKLNNDWGLFGTVGAFPVEYTNDTATSNGFDKEESDNKWLYGAQVGAKWAINAATASRARAYYRSTTSKASVPALARRGPAAGLRHRRHRAAFMQKGNSVFLLRDITRTRPTRPPRRSRSSSAWRPVRPARPEPGLGRRTAARLQAAQPGQLHPQPGLRRRRHAQALEGRSSTTSTATASLKAAATRDGVLHPRQRAGDDKRGDWNLFAGYKYIQPDALPDGFNDSSFHLGGTNAKGYFIGGNYGIDKNIYASARWLSASEVYGAPFEVDVMQLELNTRF